MSSSASEGRRLAIQYITPPPHPPPASNSLTSGEVREEVALQRLLRQPLGIAPQQDVGSPPRHVGGDGDLRFEGGGVE